MYAALLALARDCAFLKVHLGASGFGGHGIAGAFLAFAASIICDKLEADNLFLRKSVLLLDSRYRRSSQRPDCVAGHVGLELRYVVTKYPFESSRRFAEIQPNF